MRRQHLGVTAAAWARALPDKPAFAPGTAPSSPIRLGAWARWIAREGGTGGPAGATRAAQRARIGLHPAAPHQTAVSG
jgi:hypothetical protein